MATYDYCFCRSSNNCPKCVCPCKKKNQKIYDAYTYYTLCGWGGAHAGGLTTLLHPKEVVQQMGQYSWERRQHVSRPTVLRRALKGAAKFGLYDGFKDLYKRWDDDGTLRVPVYVWSALSAQAAASALFPGRVALFVRDTAAGLSPRDIDVRIKEHLKREIPLNARRMRNAAIQFPCYELAAETMYERFKPKADCSKREQLAITLVAGAIAGFACAIVTHPFDVRPPSAYFNGRYAIPAEHLGLGAFAGRASRMAALLAAQWTIYEGFKMTCASVLPANPFFNPRKQPEVSERLRKKLEELKLKKMNEQTFTTAT